MGNSLDIDSGTEPITDITIPGQPAPTSVVENPDGESEAVDTIQDEAASNTELAVNNPNATAIRLYSDRFKEERLAILKMIYLAGKRRQSERPNETELAKFIGEQNSPKRYSRDDAYPGPTYFEDVIAPAITALAKTPAEQEQCFQHIVTSLKHLLFWAGRATSMAGLVKNFFNCSDPEENMYMGYGGGAGQFQHFYVNYSPLMAVAVAQIQGIEVDRHYDGGDYSYKLYQLEKMLKPTWEALPEEFKKQALKAMIAYGGGTDAIQFWQNVPRIIEYFKKAKKEHLLKWYFTLTEQAPKIDSGDRVMGYDDGPSSKCIEVIHPKGALAEAQTIQQMPHLRDEALEFVRDILASSKRRWREGPKITFRRKLARYQYGEIIRPPKIINELQKLGKTDDEIREILQLEAKYPDMGYLIAQNYRTISEKMPGGVTALLKYVDKLLELNAPECAKQAVKVVSEKQELPRMKSHPTDLAKYLEIGIHIVQTLGDAGESYFGSSQMWRENRLGDENMDKYEAKMKKACAFASQFHNPEFYDTRGKVFEVYLKRYNDPQFQTLLTCLKIIWDAAQPLATINNAHNLAAEEYQIREIPSQAAKAFMERIYQLTKEKLKKDSNGYWIHPQSLPEDVDMIREAKIIASHIGNTTEHVHPMGSYNYAIRAIGNGIHEAVAHTMRIPVNPRHSKGRLVEVEGLENCPIPREDMQTIVDIVNGIREMANTAGNNPPFRYIDYESERKLQTHHNMGLELAERYQQLQRKLPEGIKGVQKHLKTLEENGSCNGAIYLLNILMDPRLIPKHDGRKKEIAIYIETGMAITAAVGDGEYRYFTPEKLEDNLAMIRNNPRGFKKKYAEVRKAVNEFREVSSNEGLHKVVVMLLSENDPKKAGEKVEALRQMTNVIKEVEKGRLNSENLKNVGSMAIIEFVTQATSENSDIPKITNTIISFYAAKLPFPFSPKRMMDQYYQWVKDGVPAQIAGALRIPSNPYDPAVIVDTSILNLGPMPMPQQDIESLVSLINEVRLTVGISENTWRMTGEHKTIPPIDYKLIETLEKKLNEALKDPLKALILKKTIDIERKLRQLERAKKTCYMRMIADVRIRPTPTSKAITGELIATTNSDTLAAISATSLLIGSGAVEAPPALLPSLKPIKMVSADKWLTDGGATMSEAIKTAIEGYEDALHHNMQAVAKYVEQEILKARRKSVGLMPIGGKLHTEQAIDRNVVDLIAQAFGLKNTPFTLMHANTTVVVNPMLTALEFKLLQRALHILGAMDQSTIDLQTAGAGRLPRNLAAVVGSSMVLGTLGHTPFADNAFETSNNSQTGSRIMAYDAGVRHGGYPYDVPEATGRTDKLGGEHLTDVDRHQLLQTLAVHRLHGKEFGGITDQYIQQYLAALGTSGLLPHLTESAWVYDHAKPGDTAEDHLRMVRRFEQAWMDATQQPDRGIIAEVGQMHDKALRRIQAMQPGIIARDPKKFKNHMQW